MFLRNSRARVHLSRRCFSSLGRRSSPARPVCVGRATHAAAHPHSLGNRNWPSLAQGRSFSSKSSSEDRSPLSFNASDVRSVTDWFTTDAVRPPGLFRSFRTFFELCILRNMDIVDAPSFLKGSQQAFLRVHKLLLENNMAALEPLVEEECFEQMRLSMNEFETDGFTFNLNPRSLEDTPLDVTVDDLYIDSVSIQFVDYQYEDAEELEVKSMKVSVHVNVCLESTERYHMMDKEGTVVLGEEPRKKKNVWKFSGVHHQFVDEGCKETPEPLVWRLLTLDTEDKE